MCLYAATTLSHVCGFSGIDELSWVHMASAHERVTKAIYDLFHGRFPRSWIVLHVIVGGSIRRVLACARYMLEHI